MANYLVRPLIFLGILVLTKSAVGQHDRSCNALQAVQLGARLNRLPDAERQRYGGAFTQLQKQMDTLFTESRKIDQEFSDITNRYSAALAKERPDLVKKARSAVLKEAPELAARGQEDRLNEAIWERMEVDPQFSAELQRRLRGDANYDTVSAAALRSQVDQYHHLEEQFNLRRLETPPERAVYDQKVNAQTQAFVEQRSSSSNQWERVTSTAPFRELLGTVATGQAAARSSLSELRLGDTVSQSRLYFDTPGDPVVAATEDLRGTIRALDSQRLRYTLDFDHTEKYLPPPNERSHFATNSNSQLSRQVVEAVAHASLARANVDAGYDQIKKIQIPPPPPSSGQNTPSPSWTRQVVGQVKEAAKKGIEYVLD